MLIRACAAPRAVKYPPQWHSHQQRALLWRPPESSRSVQAVNTRRNPRSGQNERYTIEVMVLACDEEVSLALVYNLPGRPAHLDLFTRGIQSNRLERAPPGCAAVGKYGLVVRSKVPLWDSMTAAPLLLPPSTSPFCSSACLFSTLHRSFAVSQLGIPSLFTRILRRDG